MLLFLIVTLFATTAFGNIDVFDHGRILGGQNATVGQFRHMASLRIWWMDGWYHNCGGSLITDRWILTAAHCLTDLKEDQIKVYLGTVTTNGDGDIYDPDLLLPHPDFSTKPIKDDVGLIKLMKIVTYTANVYPIRISNNVVGDGATVTLSGFGRLVNNESAKFLQYLTQTVWSNERCNDTLQSTNLNEKNVCAFNADGNGACNGDSGSPLINDNQQVGIASWVRQPCGSNHPDVYVRVKDYLNWISLQVTIHG